MKIRIISNKGEKIKRLKPTDRRYKQEAKKKNRKMPKPSGGPRRGRVLNVPTVNHRRESRKIFTGKFYSNTRTNIMAQIFLRDADVQIEKICAR